MAQQDGINLAPVKKRETDILFKGMSEKESVDFQLKEWVAGKSIHNAVRDECCPDFSCCSGNPPMNKELRERFQKATEEKDEKTRYEILGMALSGVIADAGVNAHIAGESGGNA